MSVTSEEISRVLKAVPTELLIGGNWVAGEDTLDVEDPSTGDVLTSVADASSQTGHRCPGSRRRSGRQLGADRSRPRKSSAAFTLITERADDIALLMTLEMGKPLSESRAEVTYGAEFFRWFSEEAVRVAGRYAVAPSGGTRLLTMKQPVGPVYAITPWNFPLAMGTRKLGPAVAAGCTVVIKPAAQTPLTTLALAGILTEAGLPDGVLNVITTSRSGENLIADHRRSAASQAHLHRFDRGWSAAHRAICAAGAQDVDGAGRQCSLPRVLRCRPGQGPGGRDAGQDAQHRRGLYGG